MVKIYEHKEAEELYAFLKKEETNPDMIVDSGNERSEYWKLNLYGGQYPWGFYEAYFVDSKLMDITGPDYPGVAIVFQMK